MLKCSNDLDDVEVHLFQETPVSLLVGAVKSYRSIHCTGLMAVSPAILVTLETNSVNQYVKQHDVNVYNC